MSDALPYQPSLASATNTRVETAARHMQQFRVSFDDMVMFVGDQAIELQGPACSEGSKEAEGVGWIQGIQQIHPTGLGRASLAGRAGQCLQTGPGVSRGPPCGGSTEPWSC